MKRRTWIVPFALAALLALITVALVAGCKSGPQTIPIKTLLDDPSRFDHQTVRIAGHVTKSLGLMGYGAYMVDDSTASIAVVSKENGAPRTGAFVGVEGEFRSAFTLGTETAAVLQEIDRVTK